MFFTEAATITLDPDNAAPESLSAAADVANFSVSASFDNPVSGSFRAFSYGVKFRESDGLYHAVTFNSAGELRYLEGTAGQPGSTDSFNVIQRFDYDNVKILGFESNSLHLTVIEDSAWLFANGVYVTEFTVGGAGISSDVQFIAELENETQISGARTEVVDLVVRDGQLAASAESVTLIKEQGEITRTSPIGSTIDYVVETEFVSPYERILGKWSAGFEFFDPASGRTDWVLINNSRQWKHLRQSQQGGEIEEIAGELHTGILRDRGDVNSLQVLSLNGSQRLLINGSFIADLDIQPEMVTVQVTPFTGFDSGDQQPGFPTTMTNYSAWSFGSEPAAPSS